jgi:hypothetical protein
MQARCGFRGLGPDHLDKFDMQSEGWFSS